MYSQPEDSSRIGNYLLGGKIGAGTFGLVNKATHLPTGECVAVKVIMKSKIRQVAEVQRVTRQMHILRIVRHPSIIQLYEIIQTKNYLFLVTEYLEHGELFEYIISKGHLEQQQACILFKQLIAGIRYLRELRVSHRDLKLQNLLLDSNKHLKIIDFGLSNTYNQYQQLKTACGSPFYTAPQMLGGKSYEGSGVDVWSCGVILFAMVCGFLPFEDSNIKQLYKKIRSGQLFFPQTVSPEFEDLICKILEVDPKKRYSIEQIEGHRWLQIGKREVPTLGIKVGEHLIKADPLVLVQMRQIGFDTVHTKSSVQVNKHGPDLAGYYLQLKKMKRDGYESQYDINSTSFKYTVLENENKESFQNTRKSYYFGVHQLSLMKKSKGKSRKAKGSPSKTEVEVKRKTKVRLNTLTESKSQFSSIKMPRNSVKKPIKYKLQHGSTKRVRKRKDMRQFQLMDSPVRRTERYTLSKTKQYSGSGHKRWGMCRDKKNKSCSLIQRFH